MEKNRNLKGEMPDVSVIQGGVLYLKNEVRQFKIAVILSVFTVIIFCGLFVYSWFFGYSSGKFSSALLVAGGIVILIKNYVLYYRAKKRDDS